MPSTGSGARTDRDISGIETARGSVGLHTVLSRAEDGWETRHGRLYVYIRFLVASFPFMEFVFNFQAILDKRMKNSSFIIIKF